MEHDHSITTKEAKRVSNVSKEIARKKLHHMTKEGYFELLGEGKDKDYQLTKQGILQAHKTISNHRLSELSMAY